MNFFFTFSKAERLYLFNILCQNFLLVFSQYLIFYGGPGWN